MGQCEAERMCLLRFRCARRKFERDREREKFVTEARKQRYVVKLGEDVSHVSRGRQAECWLSDVWCEDEVTPSRTTRRQFIELSCPKAYRLSCSRPLVFHCPSNICDSPRCLSMWYRLFPREGWIFIFIRVGTMMEKRERVIYGRQSVLITGLMEIIR